MLKNKATDIPYRLETSEEITLAMESNLLNLGKRNCKMMLAFAKRVEIKKTPAVLQAKDVVKNFSVIREEMTRESFLSYHEIARLTEIAHFHDIEEAIPWACELINKHENNFDFINNYSHLKEKLSIQADTPYGMVKAFISFKRLLRQEILAYSQSKKTKVVTLEDLKKIIVAATLFDPENGDALQALRNFIADPGKEVLYQNAMAELLFTRIPNFINGLIVIKSDVIRQKVFSKISRLGLTARQKMVLYGYYKLSLRPEELPDVLKKIDSVAQKTHLPEDVKNKLHNYLISILGLVERKHMIYPDLFLKKKELEELRKLHKPVNVMKAKTNYREHLLKVYTNTITFRFYPTKDYFDLMRGWISDDCIGFGLAEQQLMVPRFFNIRIFWDKRWIGNIYMLDFTRESGIILIDRIQIPRHISTEYVNFFDDLKETFAEMFKNVDYRKIVAPLTISNHKSVQEIFNHIKDKLPKIELSHLPRCNSSFEGMKKNRIHYVLCSKGEVNNDK